MVPLPLLSSSSRVILVGLAFTSRTETLEEYLKDKTGYLTVIALSSCFLKRNYSACRVYERGVLIREFGLFTFRIKDYAWFRRPLLAAVFFFYMFSVCYCLLRLRRCFDWYIGVSHVFALWGACLKRLGITRAFIYYCIDYYLPTSERTFNNRLLRLLVLTDRLLAGGADAVWNLNTGIVDNREKLGGLAERSYKSFAVPLGYPRHSRRCIPLDGANRWTIGFVGSITENQGLQLAISALSELRRTFPSLRMRIIGEGPYGETLKRMVAAVGLDRNVDFLGFIKDEARMLDSLAVSVAAIALYDDDCIGHVACADTGKPKLYAFCGLPIITTRACTLAGKVIEYEAGQVIDYDRAQFINAVRDMLANDERLSAYRRNSYRLGEEFVSEAIFDRTIRQMEAA